MLSILSLLVSLTPASACIWDRDTIAIEARGLPGMTEVLTGDFPRYPAAYYEMRIARVRAEIAERPDELALYDDQAAALDRLGRSTEAIAVIEAKRARMTAGAPATDEVQTQYRTLANLGTFEAHAWIRAGGHTGPSTPEHVARLDRAIEHIEAALTLNPDAHFGREKVQLALLRHLRDARVDAESGALPTLSRTLVCSESSEPGFVQGLAGLVVMGNAWESVDVMHELQVGLACSDERAHLATLARTRLRDLMQEQRGSLIQGAPPPGDELLSAISGVYPEVVDSAARELIEDAKARQGRFESWMTERLATGAHPDTDPDFWKDAPAAVRAVREGQAAVDKLAKRGEQGIPMPTTSRPPAEQLRQACGCASHPAGAGGLAALALAGLLGLLRRRV